jgi:hypothetical protein
VAAAVQGTIPGGANWYPLVDCFRTGLEDRPAGYRQWTNLEPDGAATDETR